MRVLLDECLPRELAAELVGHQVRTVRQERWTGMEDGDRLRHAAATFDAFLTVDKLIQHTHQAPPGLIVLTVPARANRIQALLPLAPAILQALRDANPGRFVEVGA